MATITSPVTLACRSQVLFNFTRVSRKPTSIFASISSNPVQISRLTTSSFSSPNHSNLLGVSSNGYSFKELDRSVMGSSQLGLDCFRVSAVSGSGPGGGDGGGGSGGSDGNNSGGSDGNNRSLLSWYLALLEKHPVLTKAVTAAILTLIGDVVCQLVINQNPSLDLKRTSLFTLLGLVLVDPTLHFWYSYLNKLVTTSGASGAIKRLLLDQFIFSPIFIGIFLSALLTLEGRSSQVPTTLQKEWPSAVIANWQLWIPFQFLNFRFVPPEFQVLAANAVALVWNVILSFKAHREIVAK